MTRQIHVCTVHVPIICPIHVSIIFRINFCQLQDRSNSARQHVAGGPRHVGYTCARVSDLGPDPESGQLWDPVQADDLSKLGS